MSYMYKLLKQAISISIVCSLATFSHAQETESSENEKMAVLELQKEAIKLLIFSSQLEADVPNIAQVTEDMKSRYNSVRLAFFGGIPISAVAVGTASSAQLSFDKLNLAGLLRAIQPAVAMSAKGFEYASTVIGDISLALKIDILIESTVELSSDAAKAVINFAKSSVFNGSKELGYVSGGISLFGSSLYLVTNSAEDVASTSLGRKILGYDSFTYETLNKKIDLLASIFSLNNEQLENFKQAINNEITNEAVRVDFSTNPDDYNIDVLGILVKQGNITEETKALVLSIADSYQDMSTSGPMKATSNKETIVKNIDFISAMIAYLQTLSASGKITDPYVQAEVDRIIGSVYSKMAQVGVLLGKI